MLIGRRFGRPGLIGTVARTAVITGTAAMTAGAVSHHQQKKYATQQEAAASKQAAQLQAATKAAAAPEPAPAAAAPAASGDPLIDKLNQLAGLHASGVLSDQEFSDAKAKLLAS